MLASTIFFIVPIIVALWIVAELRPWPRKARLGFGFAALLAVTGAILIHDADQFTQFGDERSVRDANTRLAIDCLEQGHEAQLLSALTTFIESVEAREGAHEAAEELYSDLRAVLGIPPTLWN